RGKACGRTLYPSRAGLAGNPPGTLCGIQPHTRPRDPVRAENQRADRIHSDEPASTGTVALQPPAGTRLSRRKTAPSPDEPQRLGLIRISNIRSRKLSLIQKTLRRYVCHKFNSTKPFTPFR